LYQRIGQRDLALECFIRSIQTNQYNWSCWLSIAACVSSTTEVRCHLQQELGKRFILTIEMLHQFSAIKALLPHGQMFLFFAVTVMLDLHSATEHMLETVEELQTNYPTSVHLMAQKALVLYHMRGEARDLIPARR
jgi:anaphase-promoting complex subunit 8